LGGATVAKGRAGADDVGMTSLSLDVLDPADVRGLDASIAACALQLQFGGVLGFLARRALVRPDELSERMAAHGLQTADVLDIDATSYSGYAVKT